MIYRFRISATAKISDWEDVKVEVIFVNVDGKTQYKVGIFVPKLELCEMVKTYFGKEVDHGCWLKEVDYSLYSVEIKLFIFCC